MNAHELIFPQSIMPKSWLCHTQWSTALITTHSPVAKPVALGSWLWCNAPRHHSGQVGIHDSWILMGFQTSQGVKN